MPTWPRSLIRSFPPLLLPLSRSASSVRRPRRRPAAEMLESRTLLSFGDLDAGFGTGGKVVTEVFGLPNAQLQGALLQPDGKIVAVGSGATAGPFALVRYTPDGSLDPTFGSGSEVLTTLGGLSPVAAGIALQPDGKLVVVGTANYGTTTASAFMARFNADGSLDPSFGTGGVVVSNFAGSGSGSSAAAVALQADGKILVGVDVTLNQTQISPQFAVFVARYNPDGSPDSNSPSATSVNVPMVINALAVQPDGRILASTEVGSTADLDRYTANLGPDPTFGANGVDRGAGGNGLVLQPDGRILVAGIPTVAFTVARYNVNGNADTTFGAGGRVITDFGTTANAFGVVVLPDGVIVAAGTAGGSFAVAAYDPNGTPDTAFGSGGTVTTPFSSGTAAAAAALLAQPDGKLVAAGTESGLPTGSAFALARYLPEDVSADPTQRWLAQVYLDVLQRPIDPGGQSNWTAALAQGASRTQVVVAIEASPEFHTLVVQGLYGLYLNRPADPGGMDAFVQDLNSGVTVEVLRAVLLGSDEYFLDAGSTMAGFLSRLYRDVLGRSLEPGGQATWGAALGAGASRTAVAGAVLTGQEADQGLVELLYAHFLRRPADSGGLTTFTEALQRGARDETVIATIVGSHEYFERF